MFTVLSRKSPFIFYILSHSTAPSSRLTQDVEVSSHIATSNPFSQMSELEIVLSAFTPSTDGLFILFTRLPPKLRLQVWFFANSYPRVILIEPAPKFVIRSDSSLDNRQCAAESTTPALLHACYESRDFALKNYKLRFCGQISRPVYFDECKDMLAFRSNLACRSLSTIDDWYRRWIVPNVRFLVFAFPYSPLYENLSGAMWSALSYQPRDSVNQVATAIERKPL